MVFEARKNAPTKQLAQFQTQMPPKRPDAAPVEYNITRLNTSTMDPGRVICIIGRSGSGKTMIARDLLFQLARKSHVGLIFSATEQVNGTYSRFVPGCLVYPEFREDKVFDLLHTQAQKRKAREGLERDIATMVRLQRPVEADRLRAQLREREARERAFIVIDDLAYSQATFNNDAMKAIMFNSRHFNIMTIISVQYSMILSTALRANLAFVFVAREPIYANRQRLHQHFFGVFPTYSDFERVFSACTDGYDFICLDNTSRSMKPDDCVHWYRANVNLPPFRLCSESWWRYHARNFDPNFEEKLRKKKMLELKGSRVKKR
jgi:ABC-type iron transport system FetAB ATPase subunit